jgi:hypothetical protein
VVIGLAVTLKAIVILVLLHEQKLSVKTRSNPWTKLYAASSALETERRLHEFTMQGAITIEGDSP